MRYINVCADFGSDQVNSIMTSRKKKTAKKGEDLSLHLYKHHDEHHLPGWLLVAFGLLALPVQFDLIEGIQWAKAWPLLLVLVGIVLVIKTGVTKVVAHMNDKKGKK